MVICTLRSSIFLFSSFSSLSAAFRAATVVSFSFSLRSSYSSDFPNLAAVSRSLRVT